MASKCDGAFLNTHQLQDQLQIGEGLTTLGHSWLETRPIARVRVQTLCSYRKRDLTQAEAMLLWHSRTLDNAIDDVAQPNRRETSREKSDSWWGLWKAVATVGQPGKFLCTRAGNAATSLASTLIPWKHGIPCQKN